MMTFWFYICVLVACLCCFWHVECFSQLALSSHRSWGSPRRVQVRLDERRSNPSRRDDDANETPAPPNGFPQLPPIGASSLKDFASTARFNEAPFVANHKFQLQYTCNICETRNYHNVSRLAYRQGVVITRCKGCGSQHLIADNLGWTDHEGGFQGNETNTIEDYFKEDGKVSRVTSEVFELEKLLKSYDSKSGAIIGDDGKLALE